MKKETQCDSCANLYIDPPSQENAGQGIIACGKGHWEGDDELIDDHININHDPWKFCKDYEANI